MRFVARAKSNADTSCAATVYALATLTGFPGTRTGHDPHAMVHRPPSRARHPRRSQSWPSIVQLAASSPGSR